MNMKRGYGDNFLMDFTLSCPICHSDKDLVWIHQKPFSDEKENKIVHTYLCNHCIKVGRDHKLMVVAKHGFDGG